MKMYRKAGITAMIPWTPGADMDRVSVSEADKDAGSPKVGDMIACNPANTDDRWLIEAGYFLANYAEA